MLTSPELPWQSCPPAGFPLLLLPVLNLSGYSMVYGIQWQWNNFVYLSKSSRYILQSTFLVIKEIKATQCIEIVSFRRYVSCPIHPGHPLHASQYLLILILSVNKLLEYTATHREFIFFFCAFFFSSRYLRERTYIFSILHSIWIFHSISKANITS